MNRTKDDSRVDRGGVSGTLRRAALPGTLALVFLLGGVAGGIFVMSADLIGAESSLESEPAYETFQSVWDLVHSEYIDQESIDNDELLYAATRGMVDVLDDKGHTDFLDPTDAEAFRASMSGELIGIGIRIDFDGDRPTIIAPIAGSPADVAGVERGDIIIAIDGADTRGKSEGELSSLLRGEEGESIDLTIRREDNDAPVEVSITRARFEIDQVVDADLPGDILLIRVQDFSAGTGEELRTALKEELTSATNGIVLDLRGNPGGLVSEAISVASQFMPEGTVIFQHESRGEEPRPVETVGQDDTAFDIPLVVLVDGTSASAAEIVAAALFQNDRAQVIGETTFGTGTVVSSYELEDGSIAAIGTAFWRSPDGDLLWNIGFTPPVELELDEEGAPLPFEEDDVVSELDIDISHDNQLDAAVAFLASGTVAVDDDDASVEIEVGILPE